MKVFFRNFQSQISTKIGLKGWEGGENCRGRLLAPSFPVLPKEPKEIGSYSSKLSPSVCPPAWPVADPLRPPVPSSFHSKTHKGDGKEPQGGPWGPFQVLLQGAL